MSKRAHLSFGLVGPMAAVLLLAFAACGDDDDSGTKDAGAAGKSGGGGSPSTTGGKSGGTATAAGSGGRAATAGSGGSEDLLTEGDQCTTSTDCETGLTCVVAFVDESTPVRICARACVTNADCGKVDAGGAGMETCDGYTDRDADKHCINLEPDAWAPCGVGYTSLCDNKRSCLYFPQRTVGVCADLCQTDPTMDAGVSDVPAMCPAGDMCVPGIVAPETVGVCGKLGARDALCDQEKGEFCSGTDLCVPDDLNADTGPQHCLEDCTDTQKCSGGGTCVTVAAAGVRYCKK